MTRPLCLMVSVLLLALPLTAMSGVSESRVGNLTIRMDQNMLTVKAREIPHRRILEGLASRLRFELSIAGPLEERQSLEIEGRPWEEALKKALSPASWAFVYDASVGEPHLAKIFVFPLKEDGSGPLRSPSTAKRVISTPQAPRPMPEPQVGRAPELANKGADASLTEVLEAEDEEVRALALVGLASMGGEQAITALRQALQDKAPLIRETAVETLAEIGGEQAIQGLQQAYGRMVSDRPASAASALGDRARPHRPA